MLSATPHDGKARSFASLVNMLDATAIADPARYTAKNFRPGLVIRRFKKDVQDDVRSAFPDREVFTRHVPASAVEEKAYDALLAVRIASARRSPQRDLFVVTLEKALFSSPAACIETVDERIGRREREVENIDDDAPIQSEVSTLRRLRDALDQIAPTQYAKYQALLAAIGDSQPFDWQPSDTEDRLVIFTERIATLNWLKTHLIQDLKLKPGQIETLHGGMSDIEQQRVVEDFGNTQRSLRLLICSDVASEGINLHYQCHRLIHFDMPWSLMVFQQRNGRVDRYGQTAAPKIVYLVTASANPTIRGDTRILEVLMEKDEQAYKNIGDPSVFMDVHDVDEEETITRQAIANGESPGDFDSRLTPTQSEGENLLEMFLQGNSNATETQTVPAPPPPLSLFENDLQYCEAALHRLHAKRSGPRTVEDVPVANAPSLRFAVDADSETLTLDAPEDLVARYSYLPPEVMPSSRRFVLTTNRHRMAEAIAESRRAESAWPSLHFLWHLSPVVAWLNDRMLAAFGRSKAPVLAGIPGLAPNESIFVFSGLVPNQKSHPLVYEWIAVSFLDGSPSDLIPFEVLIKRTGLDRRAIANRQKSVDVKALSELLPQAVSRARKHFTQRRDAFEETINAKLEDEVRALDEFKARQLRQLEVDLDQSRQAEQFKRSRAEQTRHDIQTIHDEYLTWIEETMTTEPYPWIKVICAMT